MTDRHFTPEIEIPFYRKRWFVVGTTVGIITFPIALLILATGNVYRRKDGELVPISGKARAIYAGALGIWLVAVVVNRAVNPDSWEANDPNIGKAQAANTKSVETAKKVEVATEREAPLSGIPECNDPALKAELRRVIQRAHDGAGMPIDNLFRTALDTLGELNNGYARRLKRNAAAESDGVVTIERTRVCAPTEMTDFMTVLVSGDGKGSWGGLIINTPFPPISFGD